MKKIKWPEFNENILKEDFVNIVIQINGKKRGLIQTKPDLSDDKLFDVIIKDEKINKYINGKDIKRKIYIKINY